MKHKCKECGKEIISWTDEVLEREIKEHYLREHGIEVEVVYGWDCVVRSSTMPHKGLVQTFRVIKKRRKEAKSL